WERFIASQMSPAVYDQTGVDIEAKVSGNGGHRTHGLRASGRVLKFGGRLEAHGQGGPSGAAGGGGDDEAAQADSTAGGAERGAANGGTAAAGDENAKQVSLEELSYAALPELTEGEVLTVVRPPGVLTEQKFTLPPPRYNEGSLVRELEKRGIGRPSTYAEII